MSSRRSPSRRNAEYGVIHQARQLQSMVPGTAGGRLASARPVVSTGAIAEFGTDSPGVDVSNYAYDRFPASGTFSATQASVTLSYIPLAASLHVVLNGVVLDEGTDYTVSDTTVTFTSAVSVTNGDAVWARYAYSGDVSTTIADFSLFTDDFNRADSTTLGSNWIVASMGYPLGSPVWSITSNQAGPVAGAFSDGSNVLPAWAIAAPPVGASGDIDMSVVLSVASTAGCLGFRIGSDYRSGWLLNTTQLTYFTYGGSAGTLIGTIVSTSTAWGVGFGNGDTARVVTSGNTIQLYRNGVLLATVTDSRNATATRHGLALIGNDSAVRWDNFSLQVS